MTRLVITVFLQKRTVSAQQTCKLNSMDVFSWRVFCQCVRPLTATVIRSRLLLLLQRFIQPRCCSSPTSEWFYWCHSLIGTLCEARQSGPDISL